MNSEPGELRREFLDEFHAECDELLSGIRAQLNRLESACRDARPDPAALEALYRHAHSLKGISAMVGLREAEQLAHSAEGLLRQLSRGETTLTAGQVELLDSAAQRLEQIVAAHRLRHPLPAIADLLARLAVFNATAIPAPSDPTTSEVVAAVKPGPESERTAGGHLWRASFAPSAELDKRGININTVRARLAGIGDITSAAPMIQGGGRMTFDFTIRLKEAPASPETWEEDGILLRPFEIEGAPSNEAGTAAADAPSSLFIAPSHIVRVDLSRLDELMRIAGEMVIHRSRLEERIARAGGERSEFQDINLALGRSLRELREAITRVRLVPISEIFNRLPFVVRDLAREEGKRVRILVEGENTEIDKYVVERLKEPILHLVRNAVSHGIEAPEERRDAGKPEDATLALTASASGQSVVIQIRDDGRGLDARKIVERAALHGIPLPDEPTEADLLSAISQPGFSTRDSADRAAGRGVGMAVVQRTVRDLAGSLSLETKAGAWTRFTLRLPLTLSIADTFLVSVAGQICAVPRVFVEEILQFTETEVLAIQNAEVIPYREGVLPLIRLRQMFGAEASSAKYNALLVLATERGLCGVVVDRVRGEQEVVVRAMQDPLIQVPGVSGATELGDGRPVLILDPISLTSGMVRPRLEPAAFAPGPKAREA